MKKKMRKFADGGYSTVDPSNPVPSIDDDTRSRALKYVEGASEESRDIGAPVTRSASKSSSSVSQTVSPPKKAPVETPEDYKERMEGLTKKQALVNVHPEDYVPGPAMLKPLLRKVVSMGAKKAEQAAAESVAKNAVRKAEEGFNPSEALDALKPSRTINVKGKDIPIKQGKMDTSSSPKAGEFRNKSGKKVTVRRGNEGVADDGGSGAFKRGGMVSSASKRADGCAVKGKTRGRYL